MPREDGRNKNQNDHDDDDDYDIDVYLAMGPAFFGFYGYFGALSGMEDALFGIHDANTDDENAQPPHTSLLVERKILRGVSGASAGAMAAILLAAGISPHRASSFVSELGLSDFADPGGLGGILKGDRFESLMAEFLRKASPILSAVKNANANMNVDANGNANLNATTATTTATAARNLLARLDLHLQHSLIPVAVSAVDIHPQIQIPHKTTTTTTTTASSLFSSSPLWWADPWSYMAETYLPTAKILTEGSMARAARASACFPGLFQPVGWLERSVSASTDEGADSNNADGGDTVNANVANTNNYSLLIDGGIFDLAGYNGLKHIIHNNNDDINDSDDDDSQQTPPKTNKRKRKIRILNMVVGSFVTSFPPGPKAISQSLGLDESEFETDLESVFSLSIRGLPNCGPLSMTNGPLAINAARTAVREAMDRPIVAITAAATTDGGQEQSQSQSNHFVLDIDASSFVDKKK